MSSVDELRELLDGRTDAEIRAMCIEVLRQWHKTSNTVRLRIYGNLSSPLLAALAAGRPDRKDVRRLDDVFLSSMQYEFMAPVLESMLWMVRAGLMVPLGVTNDDLPQTFHLTRAGTRFLESDDSHPLLPGAVARMKNRCPGLPDEIIAVFADAHSCFEHRLLRPAIALLGVAYEAVIEDVADSLLASGFVTAPVPSRAAQRLRRVRDAMDQRFPGNANIEARAAAVAACDFADDLRRRRNDASHTTPRYAFDDDGEVEEALVSASRYLPSLWAAM